jgi:hypothetical protein
MLPYVIPILMLLVFALLFGPAAFVPLVKKDLDTIR